MRSDVFRSQSRGGLLSPAQHHALMHWAVACMKLLAPSGNSQIDAQIDSALDLAVAWGEGGARSGSAILAARSLHASARACENAYDKALLRAAGHCLATAHMADHALGVVLYGAIALKQRAEPSKEFEQKCCTDLLEAVPEYADEMLRVLMEKRSRLRALRED